MIRIDVLFPISVKLKVNFYIQHKVIPCFYKNTS